MKSKLNEFMKILVKTEKRLILGSNVYSAGSKYYRDSGKLVVVSKER